MKRNIIFAGFIIALVYLTACSEEIKPIFIDGNWNAFYFEQVDCLDSLDNIQVDFNKDSVYNINGKMVKFLSYTLDLDANGEFMFSLVKNVDGKDTTEIDMGTYLSSGFNDIVFCKNECTDSMFKTGIYVRTGNQLDLSWLDTLDIGCGVVFQADLN